MTASTFGLNLVKQCLSSGHCLRYWFDKSAIKRYVYKEIEPLNSVLIRKHVLFLVSFVFCALLVRDVRSSDLILYTGVYF